MLRRKISIILWITLCISGCASTPEERAIESAKLHEKYSAEQTEKMLDEAPEWYLEPKGTTDEGFYASGTSLSSDLSRAQNKAMLKAEFKLAKLYGQELSGLEQFFSEDKTGLDVVSDSRIVIEKLVKKANITGYVVSNSKVFEEKGKTRYYIELFYPRDTFNRQVQLSLVEQGVPNQAAKEAYQLLQNRLKENLE